MTQTPSQKGVEIYSKFFGKEWADFLYPFLSSKDYEHIGRTLTLQKNNKISITPKFDSIFRAFKECPFYKLHTIIIGQEPYIDKTEDGELVADGIAFSSRNSNNPPPHLDLILDAIDQSVYPDGTWCPTSVFSHDLNKAGWDLNHWSRQGILLLNMSMTSVVKLHGMHIGLWRPFIDFVINKITNRKDSLGIILMGEEAKKLLPIIQNPHCATFTCEHPAAAQFYKRAWKHENVFSRLTAFQKEQNNIQIKW